MFFLAAPATRRTVIAIDEATPTTTESDSTASLTRRGLLRRAAAAGALLALPGPLVSCGESGEEIRERAPAPRPGTLPGDGSVSVAGVALPPGRGWAPPPRRFAEWSPARGREAAFWCTDAEFEGGFDLARRLAKVFPRTGLWPCLWLWTGEPPASYCGFPEPIAAVDAGKTRRELARQWRFRPARASWVAPLGPGFPGLAEPTGPAPAEWDPFAPLETRQRAWREEWDPSATRARLMLIPCRRPADTVAVTGLECGSTYAGVENPALVSSVLRSWEDRFAATLVALAPRGVVLAVGSPPATLDHALRIAAEHWAFASRGDDGVPGALLRRARALLTPDPAGFDTVRDIWEFHWDE